MFVLGQQRDPPGVTTQDNYADATTLRCPGAVRVNIEIRNAAATVQFAYRYGPPSRSDTAPNFTDEVTYGRTVRSLDRNINGVRVKSAVAGSPARVTIEAMTADEVN